MCHVQLVNLCQSGPQWAFPLQGGTFAVLVLTNRVPLPGRRGGSFTCHLPSPAWSSPSLSTNPFSKFEFSSCCPPVSTNSYRLVEKLMYILTTIRVP